MYSQEIHHIKTYIAFFIISATLIWVLTYLYIPLWANSSVRSSVITNTDSPTIKPWQSLDSQNNNFWVDSSGNSDASERRIRLVQLLIRAQKELQLLEAQRTNSSQWLDAASEQKITQLREKIATIEKIITTVK